MRASSEEAGENRRSMPAGYLYLKIFIEHDLTFFAYSNHSTGSPFNSLLKGFSPELNLRSIYGRNPSGQPYLYDWEDPTKFLLTTNEKTGRTKLPVNDQNVPVIADRRNNTHPVLYDLHVLFCTFHNHVVDYLRAKGLKNGVFEEAQKLVQWHYQWMILYDFLPRLCSTSVSKQLNHFDPDPHQVDKQHTLSAEFLLAAFRFDGPLHESMQHLRSQENPNQEQDEENEGITDWHNYFPLAEQNSLYAGPIQACWPHQHDTLPLFPLPGITDGTEENELLYLGEQYGLPSGEALAKIYGIEPLSKNQLGTIELLKEVNADSDFYEISNLETPLWYYLLKEADIHENGQRLGETGSRVIIETFQSVLGNDPTSFFLLQPKWKPYFGTTSTSFTMSDLIHFTELGRRKSGMKENASTSNNLLVK